MAGRKLARYVTALDDDGRMVTFEPGTTVSAKVAEGITNPKAFEEVEEISSAPEAEDDTPKAPAKKAASSRTNK
jgi:hypothetical protein